MTGFPKTSLLISTYNWPRALELCLKSVFYQVYMPDEILIADDGSTEETKELIDSYRPLINVPIKHIWHEDQGFRKTLILNEAIRQSSHDYIIQTDGDIILHPNFIMDHLSNSRSGFFVRGSRALISPKKTARLIEAKNNHIGWNDKGIENKFNAFRDSWLSSVFTLFNNKYSIEGVKGCNFSFWKKDFINVNGFNNDFVGWGREDSELAVRLINSGIFKIHLKFKAICFHLHHEIFSRERDEKNLQMLAEAMRDKIKYAPNGYTQVHPHKLL